MAPPAEISIPTTSLSTPDTASSGDSGSKKPFTLYNITLRLPLRSFVVQKRYSDFVKLHATLCQLVGQPPPEPLPGKHWFSSTVGNPELTEQRRQGLETYLRAIAESPDRRWRDTPAWRAFLNLPSIGGGGGGGAGAGGSWGGPGSVASSSLSANIGRISQQQISEQGMGQQARDPATWLELHRNAKQALHDARLHLARRDAAASSHSAGEHSAQAIEAGAAARKVLVRAGQIIAALGDGLRCIEEQNHNSGGNNKKMLLGEGELRRRKDLLAACRVEREGLEKLSASMAAAAAARAESPAGSDSWGSSAGGGGRNDGSAKEKPATNNRGGGGGTGAGADRAALFGRSGGGAGPRTGGRVIGGPPAPETERTVELDNAGVLQLQRQMMNEQDQEVEALTRMVRRQREMGLAIYDEVERQTNMLNLVNDDVDRVEAKVNVAKNRTKKIS